VLFGPEIAHIVLEMMEAKLKTEQQAAKTEGTDSPKEFWDPVSRQKKFTRTFGKNETSHLGVVSQEEAEPQIRPAKSKISDLASASNPWNIKGWNADKRRKSILENVKLTKRQKEVLTLIVNGKSSLEVAKELGIDKRTVMGHLANIYEILQVSNRVQAFRRASALGLIDL
jgi:DNA-binding CsgD family transcriptional regulator